MRAACVPCLNGYHACRSRSCVFVLAVACAQERPSQQVDIKFVAFLSNLYVLHQYCLGTQSHILEAISSTTFHNSIHDVCQVCLSIFEQCMHTICVGRHSRGDARSNFVSVAVSVQNLAKPFQKQVPEWPLLKGGCCSFDFEVCNDAFLPEVISLAVAQNSVTMSGSRPELQHMVLSPRHARLRYVWWRKCRQP